MKKVRTLIRVAPHLIGTVVGGPGLARTPAVGRGAGHVPRARLSARAARSSGAMFMLMPAGAATTPCRAHAGHRGGSAPETTPAAAGAAATPLAMAKPRAARATRPATRHPAARKPAAKGGAGRGAGRSPAAAVAAAPFFVTMRFLDRLADLHQRVGIVASCFQKLTDNRSFPWPPNP